MEVTFKNVEIGFANVASPEEAYNKLCDLLAKADPDVAWATDTYVVWNSEERTVTVPRSTAELFPDDGRLQAERRDQEPNQ